MSLKFSAKAHRYWLDGKPVPGVTTLLGKGVPKPAIPYWAARTVAEYVADNPDGVEALRGVGRDGMVNALKGIPWTKRDEAAIRGTDVHALAEQVIHGNAVEVPEHLAGYVEGYVRWLDEFGVEPVLTERSVGSREHRYAGRFDFIGFVRALGDEVWALDWKTSKGVYGETALQVAAYASAEFYVDDDAPNDELPLPQATRIGVVHVTEFGSWLYDLGAPDLAFRHFLAAKAVADGVAWRDGLIGEPLAVPDVR